MFIDKKYCYLIEQRHLEYVAKNTKFELLEELQGSIKSCKWADRAEQVRTDVPIVIFERKTDTAIGN